MEARREKGGEREEKVGKLEGVGEERVETEWG